MSLRRFDGWEPAEVHDHEYDESGRLIRTVVTREPEWDEDQRLWMLGLTLREDSECHRCGGALIETTDYQWKWAPSPPTVCFRCVALSASAHEYEKHPQHAGLIHQVTKTPRPQPGRH